MDSKKKGLLDRAMTVLERYPDLAFKLDPYLRKIPAVNRKISRETDTLLEELEPSLKPYRDRFETRASLPAKGVDRAKLLKEIRAVDDLERSRWSDGFVSGGIYHGEREHIDFLNRVYALQSQSNPLHADIFPGTVKFEAELISMTANMLSDHQAADMHICGSVTSGGTEGILMAMKSYRDRARAEKGIRKPEILAPITAHTAFNKAAEYFGMRLRHIPLDASYRADVDAMKRMTNRNTVVIVGSAPNFPHGIIDPIEEMSEFARKNGIGFHTDACLGGFVLPFAAKLGYPVPSFDFRLPGVTSMTADTHKYGYAAKGTSVVLYRGEELRRYQFFAASDWPGGLYFSPTIAGSRSGALSAVAWAALLSIGEKGYTDNAKRILETARTIREGIAAIPGLKVIGDPLFVIAFRADESASDTSKSPDIDIYRVLDQMTHRGWSLNGLHRPASVHLAVTLRHTQPGVARRFLKDLRASVDHVRSHPSPRGGMAPIYGMAGTIPVRSSVSDLLKKYVDLLYRL